MPRKAYRKYHSNRSRWNLRGPTVPAEQEDAVEVDYLKQPTTFKVRKVLRYMSLYGIRRTTMKVRGQLHMRRRFDELPRQTGKRTPQQIVGLIGCGNYAFTTIAYFLHRRFGHVIASCMDTRLERAASLARQYGVPDYTDDVRRIMDDDRIRMVYIASNHASHAEYALQALDAGKHVYVEKPHVVTEDQLDRLMAAARLSGGRIYLGFNRPGSRFGRIIKQHLENEPGAGMYNWFIAGHDIDPDHWYFQPQEGGRVLGNLCHWTDFVLRLVPKSPFPVTITPARAEQRDCDIAVTYTFSDGTIACITFSAKGHTFEGVRERFTAHKGNCLITMNDFRTLQVEIVADKARYFNLFRDHGHEQNICSAYTNMVENGPYDASRELAYVADTGWLFLKTREALEANERIRVDAYGASRSLA